MTGCSSNAIVGTDDEPLPGGQCEGACPSPLYASAIEAHWSEVFDMASTPDGGAVVISGFGGKLLFPDLVIDQSDYSGNDEVVLKLAADGEVEWVHRIKGNTPTARLAVRPDGEIVVAGTFQSTIDLGDGPRTASGKVDTFLFTILPDGTVGEPRVWSADLEIYGIVLAPNGDAVIAGSVETTALLGGTTLVPNGERDGMVARITPSGDIVYARTTSAPGSDAFWQIAALPDGDAVALGYHEEAFSWDGLSFPSAGDNGNSFLVAVDGSGAALWTYTIDPTPDDAEDDEIAATPSIATDEDGRTLVTFGALLGPPPAADPTYTLAFQVVDADGQRQAHVGLGAGRNPSMNVALAGGGDLYVTSGFHGAFELGGVEISTEDDADGYLARIGGDGAARWVRTFGAPTSYQMVTHLTVSGGRPIIGGQYLGSFALGEDDMPLADGNPRAFVAAFAP